MMRRILFLLVIFIPLLGAGCTNGAISAVKDATIKSAQKINEVIRESGKSYARNLTDKQKQIIDEWLNANELNSYGDQFDTVYTGGTPLFNEMTGESVNRFEYLFEKFPDLKDVVRQIESNE